MPSPLLPEFSGCGKPQDSWVSGASFQNLPSQPHTSKESVAKPSWLRNSGSRLKRQEGMLATLKCCFSVDRLPEGRFFTFARSHGRSIPPPTSPVPAPNGLQSPAHLSLCSEGRTGHTGSDRVSVSSTAILLMLLSWAEAHYISLSLFLMWPHWISLHFYFLL